MRIIKRALTRRRMMRGRAVVVEEPDERLVLGVEFAIAMSICLSALQAVHHYFFGQLE
jgi:hypothetical protein